MNIDVARIEKKLLVYKLPKRSLSRARKRIGLALMNSSTTVIIHTRSESKPNDRYGKSVRIEGA